MPGPFQLEDDDSPLFKYSFSNFVKKRFLRHTVLALIVETLKPNSREKAQNFIKGVLQKCLGITFYTREPFSKNTS
jgi:hypothetical protein